MGFLDKVVIVTGGSSGIGAAAALKFSKERAKVTIVGRNQSKLNDISHKCKALGSKPLVITADVTKEAENIQIIDQTLKQFGKLDVLVNNAGVCYFESIQSKDALRTFDNIISVNLRAAVHLTHLAAPHLIKTSGNIVNISSIGASAVLYPTNFAYCTSKAALEHFTRSVALELGPKGVRVNNISPGVVKTHFLDSTVTDKAEQEKFFESLVPKTALGRISTPDEIADLILYLAGEKSKSITGSTYVIDNGMLLMSY